jgi:oxalate decarboxylase
MTANSQGKFDMERSDRNHFGSNPGPENDPLLKENPNSKPGWYSFDLTHKRVQEGGWTNQVTQRELPASKNIAGVRMRLTAGAFRELHWHTANEWAFMLYGNARLSVLNPDGTVFLGDVGKGDLWYFPAGFPHSIEGLGPDRCEFLLVFDQGKFSEDNTLLLSDWVAHTPPEVLLPTKDLYIFQADLPASLAQDKAAVGGRRAESPYQFTFKMGGNDAHEANGERRSLRDRFAQLPGVKKYRRSVSQRQARRYARNALASERLRMAVLHQRQGTYDRIYDRRSAHDGLQRKRRGFCAQGRRTLH